MIRRDRCADRNQKDKGSDAPDRSRSRHGRTLGTKPGPRVVQFLRTMKIVVDSFRVYWQNIFCCFDVRRYLSWIEGLTTNQYVGGSNPSRRTISALSFRNDWQQHVRFFYWSSERDFVEGSKIETSQ